MSMEPIHHELLKLENSDHLFIHSDFMKTIWLATSIYSLAAIGEDLQPVDSTEKYRENRN